MKHMVIIERERERLREEPDRNKRDQKVQKRHNSSLPFLPLVFFLPVVKESVRPDCVVFGRWNGSVYACESKQEYSRSVHVLSFCV